MAEARDFSTCTSCCVCSRCKYFRHLLLLHLTGHLVPVIHRHICRQTERISFWCCIMIMSSTCQPTTSQCTTLLVSCICSVHIVVQRAIDAYQYQYRWVPCARLWEKHLHRWHAVEDVASDLSWLSAKCVRAGVAAMGMHHFLQCRCAGPRILSPHQSAIFVNDPHMHPQHCAYVCSWSASTDAVH